MKRLIVLTIFLSLVAGCTDETEQLETFAPIVEAEDQTTEGNVDNEYTHISDEQLVKTAIQAMKKWESYSSIYERSAKEHPELDEYITNYELKFVEVNNQVYIKYSDNYFGGQYELTGNLQEGSYIKDEYGSNTWEITTVSLQRPKINDVVADLLQVIVDEHDTFERKDIGNAQAVINISKSFGSFETISTLLAQEMKERQLYGTPTDSIDSIQYRLYPITNLALDLYTKDNFVTGYRLLVDFDIEMEETGLLIIEEAFESINDLTDIPLPNEI